MHINTAEIIKSGFRPDLSTTNKAAKLLTNWTNPIIIVAKCEFIELPVENRIKLKKNVEN